MAQKTTKKKAAKLAKKVSKKAAPKKKTVKKAPVSRKKTAAISKKVAAPRKKVASIVKKVQRKIKTGIELEDIVSGISGSPDGSRPDEFHAEGSKFDIGVQHNAQAMPSQDVPFEYGQNRAVILVVDPRFVFTYWEIRHDTLMDATGRLGGSAKLTLRFYDVTITGDPGSSPFWDVEVFDRLGNWYLKLSSPEQRLCLDIGVKNPSGDFLRIARSGILKLPAQSLASPGPIRWMVVTPSGDKLISDVEEYTEADLTLLKKILGPHFFDLLMRGRFASIAGSSLEAIFYDIQTLNFGESPTSGPPWNKS